LSLALVYFAMADSLYIGRLAGYVAILEAPPTPPPVLATVQAMQFPPAGISESAYPSALGMGAENATVDQDETILSDVDPPSGTDPRSQPSDR
jgi:hypothetical protein